MKENTLSLFSPSDFVAMMGHYIQGLSDRARVEEGHAPFDSVALATLILSIPGIIAAVFGAFIGYRSLKQLQSMGMSCR